jgi:hypothetical protein
MDNDNPLLIEKDGCKSQFTRVPILQGGAFDEKWLQEKLFQDISLIKITNPVYDQIGIIPLCREFSMHDTIRNVFLDILAITETGRLILIECKLWRNPQARREVLAQIIEYATLLKSLSYSDFSARLKRYIDCGKNDPIIQQFRNHGLNPDEPLLIDRISNSLKKGDFQLIIAGDGIRADLSNLVKQSNFTGLLSDLALLEVGVYANERGDHLLIPSVPLKTETVTRTVLVNPEGTPVVIEEEDIVADTQTRSSNRMDESTKQKNRLFWDKFIETVEFDHPDQEKPRRGGNNWVKIIFPQPFNWITAYRTKDRIGIFCTVNLEDNAENARDFFEEYHEQLKNEIDESIRLEFETEKKGWGNGFSIAISKYLDTYDDSTINEQMNWLTKTMNGFVSSLRPLCRLYNENK